MTQPDFETKYPHLQNFSRFLPELNKESDRGIALIAASYLDELLLEILKSYLIPGKTSSALLEGFNAPLGTFSTRSAAAYSLGLISKFEYEEANLIRKIRNKFAHNIYVSFAEATVIDLCSKLSYAAKSYDDIVIESRGQFSSAAVSLILNLTNRPNYVSERKSSFGNWTI